MLTISYVLADGESGRDEVSGDDKWSFGRGGDEEPTTVTSDDGRVSRIAVVIRDSGPGPVVFRGQRGEASRVVVLGDEGQVASLEEGTAFSLTSDARTVELWIGEEMVLRAEVEFDERGSVKERQHG